MHFFFFSSRRRHTRLQGDWSSDVCSSDLASRLAMRIVPIPNGQFVENCYFVIDEATAECVVIDPGEEAGLIAHKLAAERVRPVGIWLTHAHIDHVLGVPRLKAETGAPVYLHQADRVLYDHVPEQAFAFGMHAEPLPAPDRDLSHGDERSEERRVGKECRS